jgi:hypothetical protein
MLDLNQVDQAAAVMALLVMGYLQLLVEQIPEVAVVVAILMVLVMLVAVLLVDQAS